ncbi:MAG: hypothetical protein ACOC3G_06935 [Phycisphaeraceae bacterium]
MLHCKRVAKPRMLGKVSAILMGIAMLCVSVAGCSRNPVATFSEDMQYLPRQAGPGLVADPESPIPDVPKPVNFKPIVKKSEVQTLSPARTLRHVYQGRAPLAEARVFYGQQPPFYGWRLEDERFTEEGELILEYVKGAERLRIRALETGSRCTVVIRIMPRAEQL